METIQKFVQAYQKNRFLKTAIPFFVLVLGGSFFLRQFTTLRYEFRKGKKFSKEEMEALGMDTVNVEETMKKHLKELEKKDLDDWNNIRGPRPWEDSKTFQDQERKKLLETKDKNTAADSS